MSQANQSKLVTLHVGAKYVVVTKPGAAETGVGAGTLLPTAVVEPPQHSVKGNLSAGCSRAAGGNLS